MSKEKIDPTFMIMRLIQVTIPSHQWVEHSHTPYHCFWILPISGALSTNDCVFLLIHVNLPEMGADTFARERIPRTNPIGPLHRPDH
jgi:hypothetical protein